MLCYNDQYGGGSILSRKFCCLSRNRCAEGHTRSSKFKQQCLHLTDNMLTIGCIVGEGEERLLVGGMSVSFVHHQVPHAAMQKQRGSGCKKLTALCGEAVHQQVVGLESSSWHRACSTCSTFRLVQLAPLVPLQTRTLFLLGL